MSLYFQKGIITAFPTDTSFGLGVRADDPETLLKLKNLKKRPDEKYFSLMVKDLSMLKKFAHVQENYSTLPFFNNPLTVILKSTKILPASPFWSAEKIAFRISTIPEVTAMIEYPVTATSANISGQDSIFDAQIIKENFRDQVVIFPGFEKLPHRSSSEIWDYTIDPPIRIR